MKRSADGRDSVNSGLKELEKFGYLVKERIKCEDGKFNGWKYSFYEEPLKTDQDDTESKKPKAKIKKSLPKTENPISAKPPLTNTESLASTEKKQQQKKPKVEKEKLEKNVCDAGVAFYQCLEDLNLTNKQKIGLLKYSEQEVKEALSFATHPSTKIKTTLIQTLMWALKEKPEFTKPNDIEKNRKLASKGSSILISNGWSFEAMSQKAIIESTNPYNPIAYSIPYDCINFQEKLNDTLQKCKFKIMERSLS
jgi:hypothetical protein